MSDCTEDGPAPMCNPNRKTLGTEHSLRWGTVVCG